MTLKFSEKLPSIFYVFIFGNMFPESHGFVAMPGTSCIKDICSMYPYPISEGKRNVRPCDRHSNETLILRKHVTTKYKHM